MEVLLRRIFDRSVSEFKPKSFVHFARRAYIQLLPQSPSYLLPPFIFVASEKPTCASDPLTGLFRLRVGVVAVREQ